MRTLIFRIGALDPAAGGFPLALELDGTKRASCVVPGDLAVDVADAGATLSPAEAKARFEACGVTDPFRGRYLRALLGGAAVGDAWAVIREAARDQGEPLRTVIVAPPGPLRSLHWELLTTGPSPQFPSAGERSLFASAGSPVALSTGALAPLPLNHFPLRMLIVVGVRDSAAIGGGDELDAIERALHDGPPVAHQVLVLPDAPTLQRAYDELKPHVLHFIGHGAEIDGAPVLSIDSSDPDRPGDAWAWGKEVVAEAFGRWRPRLVVLNACRSGGGAATPEGLALIEAFLQLGTKAVLGMRGDIHADAAGIFADAFYRALLAPDARRPVDEAAAAARAAVAQRSESDWALPSLWLQASPEGLLDTVPPVAPKRRVKLLAARPVPFVDRRRDRFTIWRSADARLLADANLTTHPAASSLLLVTGEQGVGKRTLIRWGLRACALAGCTVAYRELPAEAYDPLTFLRLVRRGDEDRELQRPLDAKAFADFAKAIQALLPAGPGPGTPDDSGDDDRPLVPGPERLIERLFAAFRTSLEKAAEPAPLVVALAGVSGAAAGAAGDQHWAWIRKHLLDVVAEGSVLGMKLIVSVTTEERKRLFAELPRGAPQPLVLSGLDGPFGKVMREFVRQQQIDATRWIAEVDALHPDPILPKHLELTRHFMETMK